MGDFLNELLVNKFLQQHEQQSVVLATKELAKHNLVDPITVQDFSNAFCTSERNLRRKCHRLFGKTPSEIIIQYRLVSAKNLLQSGHPISDVAFALGFNTHSHFSTFFKKYEGVSPSEYKKL
ncbi:helix-turn-helix transcriptional regulator [uncultured Paraglaciecola sp.]|uniref:helix-turn-helix transcriptional regulator n=1 Tax=uncultured Paraglaciecola sp. TaxID=1765024 RepID=UPI002638D420|nr:helix-turn-helix transcriptional regulator [uncultured Paraglaciecola sp.]